MQSKFPSPSSHESALTSYVCVLCTSVYPWISFTWHPHGRHYMNICELHLEAFLHVKCLAVSLLRGEAPFAVNQSGFRFSICTQTLQRDELSLELRMQARLCGKKLNRHMCDFINRAPIITFGSVPPEKYSPMLKLYMKIYVWCVHCVTCCSVSCHV